MKYILLSAAYLCLSGCAAAATPPKYVTNWSKLEVGMTKPEVITLLGNPSMSLGPIESNPQPDQSFIEYMIGDVIVKTLLDLWFERWHYGRFILTDNTFGPSGNVYVVYFNEQGRVVRFRETMTESNKANQNDDNGSN